MSADLNIVNRQVNQMMQDLGRGVMHQLFPKDFEYYMMALELVDGTGNTIEYFVFPVMPSAITKTENRRVNIKKAHKSTLILTSTAFVPEDITIRGNFGRNFKILVGAREVLNGVAFAMSTKSGIFELPQQSVEVPTAQFSTYIKTGYGAIKILQSIIHKSNGSDARGGYRLYFYNLALGESYLVVAPSKALTLEQEEGRTNMIWNYTLTLSIVAPLESLKTRTEATSNRILIGSNALQNTVNRVGRDITDFVLQASKR